MRTLILCMFPLEKMGNSRQDFLKFSTDKITTLYKTSFYSPPQVNTGKLKSSVKNFTLPMADGVHTLALNESNPRSSQCFMG